MSGCVIKVGDIFVEGLYEGCDDVEVLMDGEKQRKRVHLQHRVEKDVKHWGDSISFKKGIPITNIIYCNGKSNDGNPRMAYFRQMKKERNAMFGLDYGRDSDSDEEIRYCVPKSLKVVKKLTAEQYAKAAEEGDKLLATIRANAAKKRLDEQDKDDRKKRAKVSTDTDSTAK